jgi:hypothetical protein
MTDDEPAAGWAPSPSGRDETSHAAKIVAIARGTLHADIVVTDSAEQALASLAKAVPDLVLISQLLSPKDDQAITDGLRQLDTKGVSVQTLVIPILSSSASSDHKQTGLLGRLRKNRTSGTAPDGCDPDEYDAQITEYLERAAAEREAAQESAGQAGHHMPPPVAVLAPPEPVSSVLDVLPVSAPDVLPVLPVVPALDDVDVVVPREDVFAAAVDESRDEILPNAINDLDISEIGGINEIAAASVEEVEPPTQTFEPVPDVEPQVEQLLEAPSAREIEEPPFDRTPWDEIDLDSPDADALVLTAEAIDLDAFLKELEGSEAPAPKHKATRIESVPAFEAVAPTVEPVRRAERPEAPVWGRFAWPRLEGVTVADLPIETDFEIAGDPELAEFAAALQGPADRLDEDVQDRFDEELWMPLATQPDYVWPRMESAPAKTASSAPVAAAAIPAQGKGKAPQDEWGLFDPDQCGMAAVMKRVSLIEAQKPQR